MTKIVGVVGATGLVGSEIVKRLEERNLDIDLRLFASINSAGKQIQYKGTSLSVEALSEESIKNTDYLLFAAGGDISSHYAPKAVDNGTIVIDNSSVFRMDEEVPLIIPEVNADAINNHRGIIANPNCSTIQSVLGIYPIYKEYGIKRLIYSTYQSVSGSGIKGLEDLKRTESKQKPEFYPKQIAYNVIPQIDSFMENGYTKEEMKMIDETNKILASNIKITATTVRVPVKYSHAVSINVETEREFDLDDVFQLYRDSSVKGLVLMDDIEKGIYPTPLDAEGSDDVYVGRIRRDTSIERGINLWCVADNIRKGASTNAVQILELLLDKQ